MCTQVRTRYPIPGSISGYGYFGNQRGGTWKALIRQGTEDQVEKKYIYINGTNVTRQADAVFTAG